jgi:hypothetical protein
MAAHLSVGEKAVNRGKLQLLSTFIAGGEGGGSDRGPTRRRQGAGGTMVRAGFPYPESLTGGSQSAFEPVVRVGKVFEPHCSRARPAKLNFLFSKLNQIGKL